MHRDCSFVESIFNYISSRNLYNNLQYFSATIICTDSLQLIINKRMHLKKENSK